MVKSSKPIRGYARNTRVRGFEFIRGQGKGIATGRYRSASVCRGWFNPVVTRWQLSPG